MKIFLSGGESGTAKIALRAILGDEMKIFLSAVERGAQSEALKISLSAVDTSDDKKAAIDKIMGGRKMKWNLMSYYYLRGDIPFAEKVRDASELIMIDSGAHSFQKGKKVRWDEYTHEYAQFIKNFDRPNVVGYFEMDVDNVLSYDKVKQLREILKSESGHPQKIIPVWHQSRGISEYKQMCQEYAGHIVAITGFKNSDIQDHQYIAFLKEAKKYGCKVHCLGMMRRAVLGKVPFDYTDSSTWVQQAIYGRVGSRKVSKDFSKTNRTAVFAAAYVDAMKMQEYYHKKWRKVCQD